MNEQLTLGAKSKMGVSSLTYQKPTSNKPLDPLSSDVQNNGKPKISMGTKIKTRLFGSKGSKVKAAGSDDVISEDSSSQKKVKKSRFRRFLDLVFCCAKLPSD